MDEVRRRTQSILSISGSAQDVKTEVQTMASLPLPLSEKYSHLGVEAMLKENAVGSNRLVKALSILEKYGCNLTSPNRPKYWRSVKHNNPVFRTTVDAIKEGRRVLYLYGYTNQQIDGLSFPDDVSDPDREGVAAVTLEVMTLRAEVDMLIKLEVCFCQFLTLFLYVCIENCSICGLTSVHAQCSTCVQRLCLNCDMLFHSHPDRKRHKRTIIGPAKTSSCTVMNQGSSILCEVCERPRLATRPPVAPVPSSPRSLSTEPLGQVGLKLHFSPYMWCFLSPHSSICLVYWTSSMILSSFCLFLVFHQWICQFCTYMNTKPTLVCEMCNLACKDSSGPGVQPQPKPRVNLELRRQTLMREDGLKLIHQIREAEKCGISPEELYAGILCSGNSTKPCDWLASELPHRLDEICAMAASVQLNYGAGDSGIRPEVERDREELEQSDPAAVSVLLFAQMRELHSLGFRDASQCEEALRLSGGEVKGALSLLQRPLLEPFHQRIWTDQPEPPIDPKHPDKQRMCRRLLALYDLPSWGRCELVLSLLQEPDVTYSLEDVVQAVKESHDKDFIRRLLKNDCPCCLCTFPLSKMQSLTSCQCSVCHECFRMHFNITVRDRHIRDMVCPVCCEPDINDQEQLDSYFSTLDIQLRDCLETDVYELFHKKLTEHALMKDPKFLWCCHCTSGFINDGDQLKVTCPSCRKSFCAQCKKPWEPQHQDLSCEQFQQWKRENDPEYQRQGLAGYLRDNGITCPHCRFQYALTKGGCMHFSCSQCRYQFCSGCNNPYHTETVQRCIFFYHWEPARLQTLLQRNGVEFNTDPSTGTQTVPTVRLPLLRPNSIHVSCQCEKQSCEVSTPCSCRKHYREYLVSLINAHSLDPALLYDAQELTRACERYQVDTQQGENEDVNAHHARLLKKLMEVPLGDKVPRNK
uniref:RING-type domain-containing protein n=1 Tax=Mola mola TaxID=94237 RepID=A0A3Q3W0N2_MOLML